MLEAMSNDSRTQSVSKDITEQAFI